MLPSKCFVFNHNTLGYVNEVQPDLFCPLASNVDGLDWKNGPVHFYPADDMKPATLADFEKFRVCAKGYEL